MLLAQTNLVTVGPGRNEFDVRVPVTVAPGTYWIMVSSSIGSFYNNAAAGGGNSAFVSYAYNGMLPATVSGAMVRIGTGAAALYGLGY